MENFIFCAMMFKVNNKDTKANWSHFVIVRGVFKTLSNFKKMDELFCENS